MAAESLETVWQYVYAKDQRIEPDQLKARLNIYEESVTLESWDDDIRTIRMVSADEVMEKLSSRKAASGILPEDALWWRRDEEGGDRTAVWRPPQVWEIALTQGPQTPSRRMKMPMPGLIFVHRGGRRPPWVYAARQRPTKPDEMLYRTPAPNIMDQEASCAGSVLYPNEPSRTPEVFFESLFSPEGTLARRSRKHPDNVLKLWEELDGQDAFPMDDLMSYRTVEEVMNEH